MFLLKNPFQLPHAGQCFSVLQRINDQYNVMVNNWFFRPGWEPGTGPRWKTFDA